MNRLFRGILALMFGILLAPVLIITMSAVDTMFKWLYAQGMLLPLAGFITCWIAIALIGEQSETDQSVR